MKFYWFSLDSDQFKKLNHANFCQDAALATQGHESAHSW